MKTKRKAKQQAEELKKKQDLGDFVELDSDSDGDEQTKGDYTTAEKDDDQEVAPDDEELIHSSLTRKRTLEDLEGDWSDEGEDAVHTKKRAIEDNTQSNTVER